MGGFYTSDYVDTLTTRIAELEAQLAIMQQIADKLIRDTTWTKITAGPETWPPKTGDNVIHAFEEEPGEFDMEIVTGFALVTFGPVDGYWLPITPPQVES